MTITKKERNRLYQLKNKEAISKKSKEYRDKNKEKLSEYFKKYREENREIVLEKKKEYYENNKEKHNENSKRYREENKEALNEYHKTYIKEKRKKDINFKISVNLRSRLWSAMKAQKTQKNNGTMEYIGCTKEFLKTHIEGQFQEGMTWENYGEWHIDHIFPVSRIDLSIEENIYKIMHFSNLQPLWADENIKKGNSIL